MSDHKRDNRNPGDEETLRVIDAALSAHREGPPTPAGPATPADFYSALAGSAPTAPGRFQRDLRSRLLDSYADPAALPGEAATRPAEADEGLHWSPPPLQGIPRRAAVPPPKPTHTWWMPRRAVSLATGLVGVVLLLVLGGVTWLTFSRLAQQQDKPGVGTPTAVSTMTAEATVQVQPAEESTYLFSIPVGEGGITYGDEVLSGFFAAAPDGTFWAGSRDYRLLHYSADGMLLGTIDIPSHDGYPSDMVTDGTDLWLLYLPEPARPGPITLYRVSPDGRKLAQHAFEINTGRELSGLILGEHVEVLLKGSFYGVMMAVPATLTAVAPVVPIVPPPVPSVVPEVYPKPLLQLIDSQGNLVPRGLEGYSYGGKLYSARPHPSSGVRVKAGDVEFTSPLGHAIFSVDIAVVEPDGSFYVDLAEEEDAGTYMRVYRTIYHYAADGSLIERVRVPEMGSKLLTGPNGNFYVLMENPLWMERGGAPPNSVDVYRLNFIPADQPLPPTPTALPVAQTWTPIPTATLEPPLDLDALISESDVIAHVRLTDYEQPGTDADVVLHLQVEEWLKPSQGSPAEPQGAGAATLYLHIPYELWTAMPENFRHFVSVSRMNVSPLLVFLTKGASLPVVGETYKLTGGPEGAFYIGGAWVQCIVPSQYDGMTLEDFKRLIMGEPTATPVIPVVPAEITPTRAPNSPPVALSRVGDSYRLDVYEGVARFGYTPWIGPSRLLVDCNSVPSDLGAGPGVYSGTTYLVDMDSGMLTPLGDHEGNRAVFPSPDGSRAVMVWPNRLRVGLYDFRTGALEIVADLDPSVSQWVGANTGISGFRPGTEVFVNTVPVWAGNDSFALTLMLNTEAGAEFSRDRALLVDIAQKQVRVLADRGIVLATFPDGSVLVRSGRIDGEVQLFRAAEKSPAKIVPSGPWRASWSPSPDGKRVAWVEMDPPPGDWSQRLPNACCSSDPAPAVREIVVWDSDTGQVRRFAVSDFAWATADVSWSQNEKLVWSKDSTALYYSTHPTLERTTLFRLSMDGSTTPLVEMDRLVGFTVVTEGNDGSIYYTVNGMDCQHCVQLTRRYPDGTLEIIQPNSSLPTGWYVDRHGRLVVLKDGGVAVTDLNTGQSSQVNFPGVIITADDLTYTMLATLVPISPDGRWAAYTKPYDYSGRRQLDPDGRPDYGRTVHIVRVK